MNESVQPPGIQLVTAAALEASVARAADAILADQHPDGYWLYELEVKIGRYLRRIQRADGGWPLFTDGAMDVSATVKAYFALKMIGDSPEAEHMQRARRAIISAGGAEKSNVFTRILLALFGVVSWRAVPMMPVE
ncbi:MAG: squalene-hopene/tetraprenyl-beta-curcumene cyclase, partial [Caballeronia sp.]|nr:squalene-hopene/tetraprenyl-beta-curcumene cyclase [Caballeronia sp.]